MVATFTGMTRFGQTLGPLVAASALDATTPRGVFVAGAALSLLIVTVPLLSARHWREETAPATAK